jgi:hypothetical protein
MRSDGVAADGLPGVTISRSGRHRPFHAPIHVARAGPGNP